MQRHEKSTREDEQSSSGAGHSASIRYAMTHIEAVEMNNMTNVN
jgi:hypothetical protein